MAVIGSSGRLLAAVAWLLAVTLMAACGRPLELWSRMTTDTAATDCAEIVAAPPRATTPRLTFAAALCLDEAGRRDAAIAAFTDAAATLERADDRARAFHNLGTLLALTGRDADALDALRAALRLGDRPSTRLNYELVARRQAPPPPRRPDLSAREDARIFAAARALERPRRPAESDRTAPRRDW